MKKAYVYFHQGWTDIICQRALIDYYLNEYDELKVHKNLYYYLNRFIRIKI